MKLEEALDKLRKAQKSFEKNKTYENALELQIAERNFEIERQNMLQLVKEEDTND